MPVENHPMLSVSAAAGTSLLDEGEGSDQRRSDTQPDDEDDHGQHRDIRRQ